MASAAQVRRLWRLGGYIPPRYVYATDGNRLYVVIDDSRQYLRLFDEFGTQYLTVKSSCRLLNNVTYFCESLIPLSYIPDKPIEPDRFIERYNYARHQILPIVYYGGSNRL